MYLCLMITLDENHDSLIDLSEEASSLSPSKRTKNVVEAVSPSVILHRMPLSPRKDINVSSPVHQIDAISSAPNTLPKTTSMQTSGRPLSRTRRNLTSSFASLTADSNSRLQRRHNSVDKVEGRTDENHVSVTDVETGDILQPTAVPAVTLDTPLTGTPSKVSAKANVSKLLTTPSKTTPSKATPSKARNTATEHAVSTVRLVRDSGMLLLVLVYSFLVCV